MDIRKIKYNGATLRVRVQDRTENILPNSLQQMSTDIQYCASAGWRPSNCVGERIVDHVGRVYVEVQSEFYQPESKNGSLPSEDKNWKR